MSTKTSIEWTDRTWNPVRGCTRVSEGCRNCYAERMAARGFDWAKGFATMTSSGPRWTGKVALIPELLDEPLGWKKPQRIFVNSMSDLFHEDLPDAAIDQVFARMLCAPHHTFQVLTKRAARMVEWVGQGAFLKRLPPIIEGLITERGGVDVAAGLRHIHIGVSVEDQATADDRIRRLVGGISNGGFQLIVSYEPALAAVDFSRFLPAFPPQPGYRVPFTINWVIVGGESGPGARPFDAAWARSAVRQCKRAGVPVFVKQMGGNVRDRNDCLATDRPAAYPDLWPEPEEGWDDGPGGNYDEIDTGYQGAPLRIRLKDRKGGDMAEWPEDLRVREFPA